MIEYMVIYERELGLNVVNPGVIFGLSSRSNGIWRDRTKNITFVNGRQYIYGSDNNDPMMLTEIGLTALPYNLEFQMSDKERMDLISRVRSFKPSFERQRIIEYGKSQICGISFKRCRGNFIHELRIKKGLTQKELGIKIKRTQKHISNLESDCQFIGNQDRKNLANVFDINQWCFM